jgi:cytochrome c5
MINRARFACLTLATGAAVCGLSGLMAQPSDSGSVDVSGYPAEVQKQYNIFAKKCSRCHDLSKPLSARYTGEAQWRELVDRMARKPGAGISRQDQTAITAFLVFHQQARAAGPAPRPAGATGSPKAADDTSSYPPEMQRRSKLFNEKCSRCHDTSRVLTAKYSGEAQWRDLVMRMARRPGAGINRRDMSEITAFLVFRERARTGSSANSGAGAPAHGADEATPSPAAPPAESTASAGGLRVEAEALSARPLTLPADGQWSTEAPAAGETIFLSVRLYDQGTGEKLPYATIRARVGGEGAAAKTLRPLFGSQGFYYGGNFAAPAGELPVSLQVEPPTLGRLNDEEKRWTGPVSFQLTVRSR